LKKKSEAFRSFDRVLESEFGGYRAPAGGEQKQTDPGEPPAGVSPFNVE
jgi:hypothetical protein